MTTTLTAESTRRGRFGRFVLHYFEMCAPMCIGFAIGDLIYFWAAGKFGYSHPFKDLPDLSVLVVTFTMTAPMVAWMGYRGMARRPIFGWRPSCRYSARRYSFSAGSRCSGGASLRFWSTG
jgi:hypothetical protein